MSGTELTEFDGEPVDPHSAELHRALVSLDQRAGEEADQMFDPLGDEQALEVVKEGEGRDLLADAIDRTRLARLEETARAPVDDEEDLTVPAKREPAEAAAEKDVEDEGEEKPVATPHAELLAAIPAKHRDAMKGLAERADRWGAIEEIAAPFAEAMKARGETIEDGIRTLAELNSFAMHKPGEYMAWFTTTMVPQQNRAKALIELGKAVGVKLIEDEFNLDDDDADGASPADFGVQVDPETARRAHAGQSMLQAFVAAKGPDGQAAHPMIQPDHPLFPAVQREIMESIKAAGAAPATIAELRKHYDTAVGRVTASMPSPQQAREKVEKAKRASAPVSSSPSTPRRATPSSVARADDDGSESLRSGLEAMFNGAG